MKLYSRLLMLCVYIYVKNVKFWYLGMLGATHDHGRLSVRVNSHGRLSIRVN